MSFSMKPSHKILSQPTEQSSTDAFSATFTMPAPKKSRKGSSTTVSTPINIPQNTNAGVGPETRVRQSASALEDYY
jgi:hypothetical protein